MTVEAIRVEGLSKKYRLLQQERERYTALRDVLSDAIRAPFRRGDQAAAVQPPRDFWALDDVSFSLKEGEIMGVIGRNGAGKSTLLKILSRITEPTRGRIELRGRLASLLEVGTGFHPELTGREIIFLNGAILGMSRSEVKRHFDEIVAFAEVERFLDTPVKRFSSGMYVRLAFAVAAHLETEILIVDEVLAVGDARFQKKCLGRMDEVRQSGRTVLLVSHNLGTILSTATSGLVLAGGRVSFMGDVREACRVYQRGEMDAHVSLDQVSFAGPLKTVKFADMTVNGAPLTAQHAIMSTETIELAIRGVALADTQGFRFAVALYSEGRRVLTMHDGPADLPKGPFEVTFELPRECLRPGEFSLALGGRRVSGDDWLFSMDIATLDITGEWTSTYQQDDIGLVSVPYRSRRYGQVRGMAPAAQQFQRAI